MLYKNENDMDADIVCFLLPIISLLYFCCNISHFHQFVCLCLQPAALHSANHTHLIQVPAITLLRFSSPRMFLMFPRASSSWVCSVSSNEQYLVIIWCLRQLHRLRLIKGVFVKTSWWSFFTIGIFNRNILNFKRISHNKQTIMDPLVIVKVKKP